MNFNFDDPKVRAVHNATRMLKLPYTGIVSGYHKLSYILCAPHTGDPGKSYKISGKIHVSPKLVISPYQNDHETFGEIFESETMNEAITGRLFSFLCAEKYNVKVDSQDFKLEDISKDPYSVEQETLDELLKQEEIKTAVIGCPDIEYYPISIDCFITQILDREFGV